LPNATPSTDQSIMLLPLSQHGPAQRQPGHAGGRVSGHAREREDAGTGEDNTTGPAQP
jgi:hypothetical protein